VRRWLRLWFSFRYPVDRRTYLRHGAGLMLFKYGSMTSRRSVRFRTVATRSPCAVMWRRASSTGS
jgi:hypothetical protein